MKHKERLAHLMFLLNLTEQTFFVCHVLMLVLITMKMVAKVVWSLFIVSAFWFRPQIIFILFLFWTPIPQIEFPDPKSIYSDFNLNQYLLGFPTLNTFKLMVLFSSKIFQNHHFILQLLEFHNFNWEWPFWIWYPMKIVNEISIADTTTQSDQIPNSSIHRIKECIPSTEKWKKEKKKETDSINGKIVIKVFMSKGIVPQLLSALFHHFFISPIVNGSNFPKRIKAKNATLEICSVFTHCAQHMFTMRIKIHKMFLLRSAAPNKKSIRWKKNTHQRNKWIESSKSWWRQQHNERNETIERTKRYLPDVWLSEWVVNCEYCADTIV